jgi:transcriptional regulator with XRE-family HTH domain
MARGDGYDHLYEAIGERVAKARGATPLSQEKLADKVGVTRASIVNIEHGRQRAPVHLLWQIASALGIETARLIPSPRELAARDAPVQLDANVVAYIERVAQDDPAAKRLLTDFVQKATTIIDGQDGADSQTT